MERNEHSAHGWLLPAIIPAGTGSECREETRPTWVAPALVFFLVALRFALASNLGLFNDEAYYWEWSRRLALSYYDHPPAVAYILAGSTRIFGRDQFAVHFPALLLTTSTSILLYRLVLELFPGQGRLAWWSVVLLNVTPLFSIGAVFTTPDAPLMFCWAFSSWAVWRALHGARGCWYLAGISSGVGMLSKYNFALFLPSVLFFLATSERHRIWLKRGEPYLATLLAVLLFTPVLVWNSRNDWVSFTFQLWGRHNAPLRVWPHFVRFIAAQEALTPLVWLACLWGLARSYRLGRAGNEAHWYLFCLSAGTYAFFAAISIFTLVNPNWLGLAFFAMMISASDALLKMRYITIRVASVLLALVVSLAFYLQAVTLIVPLPPRIDFALDLNGWSDVAQRIRDIRAKMPAPGATFVFAHRFQEAALAAFYVGEGVEVTRLGGGRDQYFYWNRTANLRGRDAVYLTDDLSFEPPSVNLFRSCAPSGDLPVVRRGRTIRTFYFFTCVDFRGG